MQNFTLPAPAKLNLFLHILNQRSDGYHNIQTIFQFIDYCDVLNFQLIKDDKKIILTPELIRLPNENNLIMRAARLLQKETACLQGVVITLDKRLPMGGGLGGGSSDAATTLLGLNKLWNTKLSVERLATLGVRLGADVPVFVYGHAAWAEGIGDQLTPMILPEPWYVLIFPPCQVATAEIFNDPRLTRDTAALTISHYQPGSGHNDFEAIIRLDYPVIAQALDWLGQFARAQITGSGGVVFAGFDTQEEASKIAAQVPSQYNSVVAKGLNQSPLQVSLSCC